MTDTNQLVKTLEEASTQFECLRIVMDSVGGWEAMRVVGNGSHNELVWVGFDGRTYTHEDVVHYGIIRHAAFVDANALLKDECGVEGLHGVRCR